MAAILEMRVSSSTSEEQPDPNNPGQLVLRSHLTLVAVDQAVFPGAVFELRVAGTAGAVAYVAGAHLFVQLGDPV